MTDIDHTENNDGERQITPIDLPVSFSREQDGFWAEKEGSRSRLTIYGLLALILGPLSLWLLTRLVTGNVVFGSIKAIKPLPLLAALVLLAIAWYSRVIRIWHLFRPLAEGVDFLSFTKSYLAGVFASQITPSAVGGYPFFLFLLYRQGIPPGRSLAVSLLDSVNTGLAFLVLLIGGALLSKTSIPGAESWLGAAIAGMCLLTAAALAPLLCPEPLQQLTHGLSQKQHGLAGKLAPWSAQAYRELRRLQWVTLDYWNHHRPLLVLNLLLHLIYWTAYLTVPPLLFLAVGGRAPWPAIVGSHIATQFALYFIPTPGAAGGAEVTMALFVHTLLPEERLVLFLGLWRFCTYYVSLIGTSLTIPWALRLLRQNATGTESEPPQKTPQEV
ncbi:MAG: flippase-like domain-containing protein [Firmicutes bacterium]|nr:flippase-like domain-containing protein [Bacillota bacterium]